MSETIDLIEPVSQLGKRRSLRSELFINNLFEEKDLPSEHKVRKHTVKLSVLTVRK